MLRIEIRSTENAAVLFCTGRLVLGMATETLRAMAQLRKEHHLRIDLSRVEMIDAAGLGLLVELHVWAREHHRELSFVELSEDVWRMVILTKLYAVLDISYCDVPALTRDSFDYERSEMIA